MLFVDLLLGIAGVYVGKMAWDGFRNAYGELRAGGEDAGRHYRQGLMSLIAGIVCWGVAGAHAASTLRIGPTGIRANRKIVSARSKTSPRSPRRRTSRSFSPRLQSPGTPPRRP